MNRKLTINQKRDGEMAVRNLCEKAQDFYYDTDPLDVYEIDTDDGKRYSVRGFFEEDNLTFDELEKLFLELDFEDEE